ncbi:RNA polymerase sigma factor [Desulfatitalea alkaliphila]|uniref:RNA polymerase sigma factor n=1 Tax=Desulfatitalea alkaliphila TaxID=2929485 RepID=A0AA41UIL3_9BACT|nr:sigma-70 family RNA polymerase sigma factor [Desulfatitalea alkaliphila]MCJ8500219.1 RNA polymerase sigma factor [Desulfatitalea alkaliphila]
MPESTDADFAINCADDLPGYRQQLILQYQPGVLRAIQAVLGRWGGAPREWVAEDLSQELFAALFEHNGAKLRSFQGRNGCSLRTWLHTVAVRRVLNHLKRSRSADASLEERESAMADDRLPADEALMHREAVAFLREAVAQLPDMDRLAFRLIFEDGLGYDAAAEVCRLSKGALYTRIFRIKARLRDQVRKAGFL